MKTKLLVACIFSITLITIMAVASHQHLNIDNESLPPVRPAETKPLPLTVINTVAHKPKIELVFALDTTGSMSGMINAAKEKIWSIASTMAAAKPTPDIRIGLVAYRDRGDDYITQRVDLSADLDSVYAALLDFTAAGGGDGPESVNAALYDSVNRMSWSQDPNSYKVIFLVGDAPGHNDYQDDIPYTTTLSNAAQKGIIVNTIQAGRNTMTTRAWKKIAALGSGNNFQVDQQGGALAISTPYDQSIAEVSRELDDTRVYYGTPEEKKIQLRNRQATNKLHTSSTSSSLARRAKFNLSEGGKQNFAGNGELLQALENNEIKLENIEKEQLPEAMQTMELAQREKFVQQKMAQRKNIKRQLVTLSEKRDAYIKKQLAKSKDAKNSLDEKLLATIKKQAQSKGLDYEDTENSY
ncbi:vWA domain-containing protein [Aliikangiella coralliicola]|uniref:VWA domain-containing protein n=1 Tax=Aliikangiella coralliicola TaxID=2592383 RepID=A0A545UEV0_9GAMM|nr:vWA domain-containing protein [Aliikangiella coralliicola]TQV88000.1 VWA domain-containing protein [Aliikangiella coralliicola]